MASKLPWFKFYAQDFLIDNRVLRLSNEQRGVYLWLLCRQWVDGSLPFDVVDVYHLLPPGSESAAVAYVLTEFFPPDPDTNERRNPRLQAERDKAEGEHQTKAETLKAARAAKSLRHNNLSDDSPDVRGRIRSQNQKQTKEEQRSSTSLKDAITQWRKDRG